MGSFLPSIVRNGLIPGSADFINQWVADSLLTLLDKLVRPFGLPSYAV
jgi:hypothetical protein